MRQSLLHGGAGLGKNYASCSPAVSPGGVDVAYGTFPTTRMMIDPAEVGPLPAFAESPADLVGRWVAVFVKGRTERDTAAMLASVGVGFYLPMEQRWNRDGGNKRRRVWRIIFESYLFACCAHEDHFYELSNRKNIVRVIRVPNQRQLVDELTAINEATKQHLLGDRHPDVRPGVRVEIIRGSMRGFQGWVERREDGREEVVLKVTLLGQSVPTTVPIEDVEPV